MVNLDKIKGYNGVNMKYGYATIEIRNPKELISYENERKIRKTPENKQNFNC